MKLYSTYITLACALLASTTTTIKIKAIKLTSSAISLIDGVFVGWRHYASMLTVRRDVVSILLGTPVNGVRVGRYLLNGNAYTLKELTDLEELFERNNNTVGLAQLQTVFIEVKKDLQTNLSKYIALAQGAKDSMLMLIDESCKKHGRKHSILHNWGATKDGQEEQQMEQDLTSLAVCSQFCVDLINFLGDMLHSCEKAHAQFDKEMERQRNNKA